MHFITICLINLFLFCGVAFAQIADDTTINPVSGEVDKVSSQASMQAATGWTRVGTDVRLTNVGDNVGIGSTSPAFKLDVNGIVNSTGLYVNGVPYIGSQWTGTVGQPIYYANNVGINTTTPVNKLEVNGAQTIGYNNIIAPTNGLLVSGNVGIGSTSPTQKLDVAGTVKSTAFTTTGGYTQTGTSTNLFSGNMAIGTTTPSTFLDVEGTSPVYQDVNAVASITGGQDANAVFLSHFDGSNGQTTYTAETGQVLTFVGNAQLSTTTPKFGTASLVSNGTGGYVTVPNSASLVFGTGNFTVDMWVNMSTYLGSVNQPTYFFGHATDSNNFYRFGCNKTTGVPYLEVYFGSFIGTISSGSAIGLNAPHHIALVRNGTVFTYYVDGVAQGTMTVSPSFSLPSMNTISIGRNPYSDYGNITGYIDEVRISNTARWTSNFTPPTAPYSTASSGSAYTQYQENGTTKYSVGYDGVNSMFSISNGDISTNPRIVVKGGNIGIGSTSPTQALDVNGTVKATGFNASGNVGISTSGPTACVCTNFKYGLCIAGSCT